MTGTQTEGGVRWGSTLLRSPLVLVLVLRGPLLIPLLMAGALLPAAVAVETARAAPPRPYYEAVLHQSGAVQKLWPIENVIAVAFSEEATPDSYYDLAESENLWPRTELKYALAERAAIYALRPDQTYAAVQERIERYPEVVTTMPGLVTESLEAAFVHPARFDIEVPDEAERAAVVAVLEREHGVTTETGPPPAALTAVTLPRGADLFTVIERAAALPGVRTFGFVPLVGTLVEHSDSYRVRGETIDTWRLEVHVDVLDRRTERINYLPVDSLLAVEYRRRPAEEERRRLFARHGLALVDPETPEYEETPVTLRGLVDFVRCAGPAATAARSIEEDVEVGGLVRGAIPALRRPHLPLETALYFRPRHLRIEFEADADSGQVEETLAGLAERGLRRAGRRTLESGLAAVDVELPEGMPLFRTARAVQAGEAVVNARPIEAGRDTEVQLRAGHRFQREAPLKSYVDGRGDTVRLHAIDRTILLTFAEDATAADRKQVADERGLTLLPIKQNLGPLAPNLLYEVPAGARAGDVAAAIGGGGAAARRLEPESRAVVTGATPGLFDRDLMTWLYAPERWLWVAFEPKMPEGEVRALLERHRLRPARDPDRPAAEDPPLYPGGAFFDYYVTRRIPVVVDDGDPFEVVERVAGEPGVLWAHPYALSPSFDRASRLYLVEGGGGWHQDPRLEGRLNLLAHLERTAGLEVVRGYAERAGVELDGEGRVAVVVEGEPGSSSGAVGRALGADSIMLHHEGPKDGAWEVRGAVEVGRLFELAELPGVRTVAVDKERGGR